LDAPRLHHGHPQGARGSGDGRRLEPARSVYPDPAALVAPGLVATSVFVFITSWNEYIFANVILTDQANQTLTVWLSYFYGTSRATDWGGLMAASTLTAIPVVIFFLLVQRKIAFGLTAGAVKA
jgi:N,N'-diacetylchitobiose transport system permease protein